MAYLKSQKDEYIMLKPKEYYKLMEDHILLTALKKMGVEKDPRYEAVKSIVDNQYVEIHIKPVQKRYK